MNVTPNPTRYPSGSQLLAHGSGGDDVASLQQLLRSRGYEVDVDGKFGPRTKEAVRAFQADTLAKRDGVVGPQTLEHLRATEGISSPAQIRAFIETNGPIHPPGGMRAPTERERSTPQEGTQRAGSMLREAQAREPAPATIAPPPVALTPAAAEPPAISRRTPPPSAEVRQGPAPVTGYGARVPIASHGASAVAVDETRRLTSAMVNRPDIADRLERARLKLVIVPHDKKLTDLPEFASLRGQRTFDGRDWQDVRGVGGMRHRGELLVALPEENLARMPGDSYGGHDVSAHEIAHVVLDHGVTDAERRTVRDAFNARQRAGGPWTDDYARSNAGEYFAQGVNAYFGENTTSGQARDVGWLQQNDPRLHQVLEGIFGPAPQPVSERPGSAELSVHLPLRA